MDDYDVMKKVMEEMKEGRRRICSNFKRDEDAVLNSGIKVAGNGGGRRWL